MAKRPTTEQQPRGHPWSIYHIKGTHATFVGTVDNAPDKQTAIARAIEEYDVPPNERGRPDGAAAAGLKRPAGKRGYRGECSTAPDRPT